MHEDLRRRALESRKTVSRKAQSQQSSRPSSAVNSRSNSRAASRHGSDDEDSGNLSDGTTWSVNSIDDMLSADAHDSTEAWKQEFNDRMEEIIDRKRSSVQGRETALMQYIYFLMSRYLNEEVEPKVGELLPALLKSVKTESSEKETSLALRAIALTIVTSPSDAAYEVVAKALKRSFEGSESMMVKAAAIRAYSTAAFFGGASDAEVINIMDELLEIIESDGTSIDAADNGEVVAAACEEWGFLATYLDDVQEQTEVAMDAFVEQLESSDPAVQVAAGENIALLYEKSYTDREADDSPAEEELDDDDLPIDKSMVKRYEVYRQTDQLKHTLAQLGNESSKHIAKRNRKVLHTTFKDVLNTVEYPYRGPRYSNAIDQNTGHRYGSRLQVRIHKTGIMTIDAWWKLHRLQALRRLLGGGFVVHYEHNEVIFDCLPIMMKQEK